MISMQNVSLKAKSILKIGGLALLAIIIIWIIFSFINPLFNLINSSVRYQTGINYADNSYQGVEPSYAKSVSGTMALEQSAMSLPGLSTRNAATSGGYGGGGDAMYEQNNYSTGDAAEQFEMTQYNATIETRQPDKTCDAVAGLKTRTDVIFENASEYRRGCGYYFKVKRDKTEEILAILKDLKPKELTSNTYTIQAQVQDYTSQIDILQKKLAVIDDTLNGAVSAYDEVAALAAKTKDVESLAKVIDSKINTIQQLTQERLNVNSRLEEIQRSKSQQLDRLDYTYFNVNITDSGLVDTQSLKNSWNAAVSNFVQQANQTAQNISVNLVLLVLALFQYAIYALVLLLVAKYGWKIGKNIWLK